MPALFSYGTLQLPEVQRALFARELAGSPDALEGYAIVPIVTRDPAAVTTSGVETHLALVPDPHAPAIDGVLFDLTDDEIDAADRYEGDDYVRVPATFRSGAHGWVYVKA